MTSAYGMSSKLIEHRIALLLTAATFDQLLAEPDRYLRLVADALTLVQQHTIDDKGGCQFCTSRRRWRRVHTRPRTVYIASVPALMPPDNLVQRQIADLLHQRYAGQPSTRTTRGPMSSNDVARYWQDRPRPKLLGAGATAATNSHRPVAVTCHIDPVSIGWRLFQGSCFQAEVSKY